MATKKPCKKLDLEAMTNREVLTEMGRIFGDVLERLDAHLDMGTGDDDNEPVLEALDDGILLHARADELAASFMFGKGGRENGVLRGRDGDAWNWGLSEFKARLRDVAAGEVMAS